MATCPVTTQDGARGLPSQSIGSPPVPVLLGGEQGRKEGQETGAHRGLLSGLLSSRIMRFNCICSHVNTGTWDTGSASLVGRRKIPTHPSAESTVSVTRWGTRGHASTVALRLLQAPGHADCHSRAVEAESGGGPHPGRVAQAGETPALGRANAGDLRAAGTGAPRSLTGANPVQNKGAGPGLATETGNKS